MQEGTNLVVAIIRRVGRVPAKQCETNFLRLVKNMQSESLEKLL